MNRLRSFVGTIACMTLDGETDADGETFEMENDDAWATVHALVTTARHLIEEENNPCVAHSTSMTYPTSQP